MDGTDIALMIKKLGEVVATQLASQVGNHLMTALVLRSALAELELNINAGPAPQAASYRKIKKALEAALDKAMAATLAREEGQTSVGGEA